MASWVDPTPCPYDFPGNLTSPFPYNISILGEMLWNYWRLDDASLPLACIRTTNPSIFNLNPATLAPGELAFPALYGFAAGMGVAWMDTDNAHQTVTAVWNGSTYVYTNATEQTWTFNVTQAPVDAAHQISVVIE